MDNKEWQKLAWRANKRLYRLEKYAERPEYKDILKVSYARAQRDIKSWRGEGKHRFPEKMPENEDIARAMMNDIKSFLRADTSTIKPGIGTAGVSISRYQSMADKFNRTKNRFGQSGDDLSWKEITTWYSSYNGKRLAKSYKDSGAVAMALGEFKKIMKNNPKKKLKDFRAELENNPDMIFSDDDRTNEAMKRMIRMGISPQNLFKQRK